MAGVTNVAKVVDLVGCKNLTKIKPQKMAKVIKLGGKELPETTMFSNVAKMAESAGIKESAELAIEVPKISFSQYILGRFTKEQIKMLNKYKTLPKNLKIVLDDYGKPSLEWNFFGIKNGTRKIPEGWVFRNDAFGFTHVDWAKYKAVYDKSGNVIYVPDGIDSCYAKG